MPTAEQRNRAAYPFGGADGLHDAAEQDPARAVLGLRRLREQSEALCARASAFRLAGDEGLDKPIDGLDFDAAIDSHLQWKQTLGRFLAGRRNAPILRSSAAMTGARLGAGCMARAARSEPTRSMRACAVVTATFIALRPRSCDVSSVAIAALPTHCCCRSFRLSERTVEELRRLKLRYGSGTAKPVQPAGPARGGSPLAMSPVLAAVPVPWGSERTSGVGLAAHGQWEVF